jgi:septum formation protein
METQPASLLPLILASASPRRRRLLAELGHSFQVLPADVDETPPEGLSAERVAEELALQKAVKVAGQVAAGTIIGADTVVVSAEGTLLGKPADPRDAARILETLSGSTHRVITALALIHQPGGARVLGHASTSVSMRQLTREEIDEYVATGEPFGKAGAYAIQERGDRFVTRLDGPYDNVVGLPGRLFGELLDALAWRVHEIRRKEGKS